MKQYVVSSGVFSLLLTFPCLALSHTGIGETREFLYGLSHPFSGNDHLLAMLAVGLWAAQMGGRTLWLAPCTFICVMVLGGLLGRWGMPIPYTEEGILLSVLTLGIFIAGVLRLSTLPSALIVGFFAIFHGYAHGAELPAGTANVNAYIAGFVVSTAMLHAIGMGLGIILVRKAGWHHLTRVAGVLITLSGACLAMA